MTLNVFSRLRTTRCVLAALSFGFAALQYGCAYSTRPPSSFSGPVAIPVATDNTAISPRTPDVAAKLTAAIRNRVAQTGDYAIANLSGARCRLDVSLTEYQVGVVSADIYGDPIESSVRLVATVSLRDVSTGAILVNDVKVSNADVSPESGRFDLSAGGSLRSGIETAIDDLARAIYYRVFESSDPAAITGGATRPPME